MCCRPAVSPPAEPAESSSARRGRCRRRFRVRSRCAPRRNHRSDAACVRSAAGGDVFRRRSRAPASRGPWTRGIRGHVSAAPAASDADLDFSYGSFDTAARVAEAPAGRDPFDFDQVDELTAGRLLLDELRRPNRALRRRSRDSTRCSTAISPRPPSGFGRCSACARAKLTRSPAVPAKSGSKLVLELVSTRRSARRLSRATATEPGRPSLQARPGQTWKRASLAWSWSTTASSRARPRPRRGAGDGRHRRPGRGAAAARRVAGGLPAAGAGAAAPRRRPLRQAGRADAARHRAAGQAGRAGRACDGGVGLHPARRRRHRASTDDGIQFAAGGDDLLAALPSADSAVLLLSGSDPGTGRCGDEPFLGRRAGGRPGPDGCYDAAAPSALVARGGESGQPAELARRLAERWRS